MSWGRLGARRTFGPIDEVGRWLDRSPEIGLDPVQELPMRPAAYCGLLPVRSSRRLRRPMMSWPACPLRAILNSPNMGQIVTPTDRPAHQSKSTSPVAVCSQPLTLEGASGMKPWGLPPDAVGKQHSTNPQRCPLSCTEVTVLGLGPRCGSTFRSRTYGWHSQKELVIEGVGQPPFISVGFPPSVDDEQSVQLR